MRRFTPQPASPAIANCGTKATGIGEFAAGFVLVGQDRQA
jgi:hypothetical protein